MQRLGFDWFDGRWRMQKKFSKVDVNFTQEQCSLEFTTITLRQKILLTLQ